MFPLKDNIPTLRFPIVTVALIAANVIVYFLVQKGGISWGGNLDSGALTHYAAIPYEFTHPGQHCDAVQQGQAIACGSTGTARQLPTVLTAFTAMFTHAGLLHLGGNMLFLWIFGNNVEDSMGRLKFLVFYLLGGLAALALQILVSPDSAVPTLGASGAIAAVLGGYILLYPRARVLTVIFIVFFFTLVEIPALLVLGIWFAEQALFGLATDLHGTGGGVAYFAHVGGFAFGLLAIKLFATRVSPAYTGRGPKYPVY